MKGAKEFLIKEVRMPIFAFGAMLRWIAKQVALGVLRFVLWVTFFLGPSFLLAFFSFHWFTGKIRSETQKATHPPQAVSYVPTQPRQTQSSFSILHTLSQDLRFWAMEFEHFRR